MSLKYSLIFATISAACAFAGIQRGNFGLIALGWIYGSLSFALLSASYAGAGPKLLLKLASGRRAALGWVLFAPYLAMNAVMFWTVRRLSAEPAYGQVMPGLFFGRQLSAREAEQMSCAHVLDLACEFSEVATLRDRPGYRSLPLLDATAPSIEKLRDAAAWVANALQIGPVYVHCALGHGRSGCVVIAYLLASGQIKTVEKGLWRLRSVRPGAKPNAAQRRRLDEFHACLLRHPPTEAET